MRPIYRCPNFGRINCWIAAVSLPKHSPTLQKNSGFYLFPHSHETGGYNRTYQFILSGNCVLPLNDQFVCVCVCVRQPVQNASSRHFRHGKIVIFKAFQSSHPPSNTPIRTHPTFNFNAAVRACSNTTSCTSWLSKTQNRPLQTLAL